jgi:iron complex transport system permease protein
MSSDEALSAMEKPRRVSRMKAVVPAVLLVVVVVLALSAGKYDVSLSETGLVVWSRLTGSPSGLDATVETVIWNVRLPRVLAGLLVGASLAAAGAVYQGLFRNPLVSPDILGVSAGASLGAVGGIFFSLPVLAIQGMAFVGGLAAVAMVYLVGSAVRGRDPVLVLVLAGVHLAPESAGRSLQSASGHHLLAARQPGQHHPRRCDLDPAGRSCRFGADGSAALAHEPDDAG